MNNPLELLYDHDKKSLDSLIKSYTKEINYVHRDRGNIPISKIVHQQLTEVLSKIDNDVDNYLKTKYKINEEA